MESSPITQIAQLARLQEIDRVRREKLQRIEEIEREVEEISRTLEERRAAVAAADAEVEAQEVRRRDLERTFEDEGAKMKDRRMRLNRVRNEKELQALRHEIEVGKEANQLLEEQVIEALETLDRLTESKEQATAALEETSAEADEKVKNSKERAAELQAEIDGGESDREELRQQIEPALLKRYELIFDRRAGVAVVLVQDGICGGCHRMLPPQMYNEIQKNAAEVRLCPSCHRILYFRTEAKAEPKGDE